MGDDVSYQYHSDWREIEGESESELSDRMMTALQDVVDAYQGGERARLTGMPSRAWLSLEDAIGQAQGVLALVKERLGEKEL